jgi:hypothetical protein
MTTAVMMDRITEASPRFEASGFRASGFRASRFRTKVSVIFLLIVLAAAFAEMFVGGKLTVTGGVVAVSGMVAVTLLFHDTLSPLNRRLSFLAVSFNLAGLAFEVLRLQPRGANIAVVFNGFFCILISCLVFRSTSVPRILGVLMAFGGLGWLTLVVPPLANYLSPYNLAFGLLGGEAVCLWVLSAGVNVQGWNGQDRTAGSGVISDRHLVR